MLTYNFVLQIKESSQQEVKFFNLHITVAVDSSFKCCRNHVCVMLLLLYEYCYCIPTPRLRKCVCEETTWFLFVTDVEKHMEYVQH
jgi:hypothetical protein